MKTPQILLMLMMAAPCLPGAADESVPVQRKTLLDAELDVLLELLLSGIPLPVKSGITR